MKNNFCYEYPRPMVTVDIILFYRSKNEDEYSVLLIKRKNEPFKDHWALPGGFIEMNENIKDSALRELKEETGISNIKIDPFGVYSNPGRDPRGRTITIAYVSETTKKLLPKAGDDASEANWIKLDSLKKLAFDHNKIITDAFNALKNGIFLFSD